MTDSVILDGDYCAIVGDVALVQVECGSNGDSLVAVASYRLHRAFTAAQFLQALCDADLDLDLDATCIATNYHG